MFSLQGFADCQGEDCEAQELLKIGLVPGNLLIFDIKKLTPKYWRVERMPDGTHKLFCPKCSDKRDAEAKKPKLSVVPS